MKNSILRLLIFVMVVNFCCSATCPIRQAISKSKKQSPSLALEMAKAVKDAVGTVCHAAETIKILYGIFKR